jgi:hypothetical protein
MTEATSDLARRDPVAFLDHVYPASGDALWMPDRQLCVADPIAARAGGQNFSLARASNTAWSAS